MMRRAMARTAVAFEGSRGCSEVLEPNALQSIRGCSKRLQIQRLSLVLLESNY